MKSKLASGLALSLEFKMAAEILKTVLVRDMTEPMVLGAAVLGRCSFSRTAGRSLIRMVWAGASAGPVVGGAEDSAGTATLCGCVPFTWAAFSLGVGPGRRWELAAVSWLGGLPASGAAGGVPEGSILLGTSWGRSLILCSGWREDRGRSWASSSSTAQLPAPPT